MPRRRDFLAIAAVAAGLVVFAAGVWRVFAVRFAAGDAYPAYSTLNAAPLGARAVYEAFGRLGRPVVERNMLPLGRFKERVGTVLVLAGAGETALGDDLVENFESFEGMMRDGLQVVVALDPRSIPDSEVSKDPVANPWRTASFPLRPGGAGDSAEADPRGEGLRVSAGDRWGFQFEAAVNPSRLPKAGYEVKPEPDGPPEVPRWFSVWRWTGLDDAWRPLATVDGRAVVVRRDFGAGSLTLVSDTVFLSNEALWRSPSPAFLLWLLGSQPRLVFDETLHGTTSAPGVMHLVRQYRLLGFLAGAAVLMGLFVWRAGTSLVPVHASVAEASDRPLAGAEGASGFTNLLRQTIPPRRLVPTCVAEWSRSPFVQRRVPEKTICAVQHAATAQQASGESPVTTCQTITALLAARRGG